VMEGIRGAVHTSLIRPMPIRHSPSLPRPGQRQAPGQEREPQQPREHREQRRCRGLASPRRFWRRMADCASQSMGLSQGSVQTAAPNRVYAVKPGGFCSSQMNTSFELNAVAIFVGSVLPTLFARAMDIHSNFKFALSRAVFGGAMTLPAAVIEFEFARFFGELALSSTNANFIRAFVIYALLEEICRSVLINHFAKYEAESEIRVHLLNALWISVGFAVTENALYVLSEIPENAVPLALIRAIFPTLIHTCCGVLIVGGATGLLGPVKTVGFGCAVLLHGMYDYAVLFSQDMKIGIALTTLGIAVSLSFVIVRRARVADAKLRVTRGVM
jgi:RsiW-degrading membrane proteinase PrsW (M82 family)